MTPMFHTIARGAGACLLALGLAAPAAADGRYREKVHADSFGNLVVYSPAGYKRIVVDKGYLAEDLAAYGSPDAPRIVHGRSYDHASAPCRRMPGSVRGRSFMYGLPDGVVPIIGACE